MAFAWDARVLDMFPIFYVFGLCPLFLVQSFKNPWSFLNNEIVFCYSKQTPLDHAWVYGNEVIHGGPSVSRDRLHSRKIKHVIRALLPSGEESGAGY